MTDLEVKEIKDLANEVRSKILKGEIRFIYSENFPKGCCGNASERLQSYLTNKGFHGVQYICGWEENQSHAWLEYKGYIIDITADQFQEYNQEPIIIIPKEESDFHKKFK